MGKPAKLIKSSRAKQSGMHLFAEFDHLGAFIKKTRFDQYLAEQLAKEKPDVLILDSMSAVVDRHPTRAGRVPLRSASGGKY